MLQSLPSCVLQIPDYIIFIYMNNAFGLTTSLLYNSGVYLRGVLFYY